MQEIRNATRDAAQPDHHWEWSSSSLEWKVSFQAQSWLLTFLAFKVMFDGPVDALWIEWLCCKWRWCFSGSWQIFEVAKGLKIITDILPRSMNTVLDDNKKLCLVSGEIIVGLQASQLPSFPASQLPSFPASQPGQTCSVRSEALTAQMRMMFEVEATEILPIARDAIGNNSWQVAIL